MIVKWRVYVNGVMIAHFENEQDARDYAKWIDSQ